MINPIITSILGVIIDSMYHSESDRYCQLGLMSAVAIASSFAFSHGCALAEITQDHTLGAESTIVLPKLVNGQTVYQIDGGTIRNHSLFHSFDKFSVPTGSVAYFNNNIDIQNIISRVTGNSTSRIDGIIKTNGTANLFLINPQGIIFGSSAALDIKGSFLASTASSLKFANNIDFSATNPQTLPLLVVDIPIGLQFGATAAEIRNQSQASLGGASNRRNAPSGLQVPLGKTIALVGGNLLLEGGNLTAKEGRIELGSVGSNSSVTINPHHQGWVLGYENVRDFQNIQLMQRTLGSSTKPSQVDVSGEGSGNINLRGRQVIINGPSQLLANTLGSRQGGNLTINASESVELIGISTAILSTVNLGSGKAGDLSITTGKLIVRNVAQVQTGTQTSGLGGKLIVNAADAVELKDSIAVGNLVFPSGLFSATPNQGDGGDIFINTKYLRVANGARISTDSSGIFAPINSNRYLPATGKGGNLTIKASESVEIIGTSTNGFPSLLSTATKGPGAAGNLTINTGQLILQNGGNISVSSAVQPNSIYLGDPTKLGPAGEINITARSIRLDNQGKLIADSEAGRGGNIILQLQDSLVMRHHSQISTNAGKTLGQGDGGNITINAPHGFIIGSPLENSDITANAFSGNGGRITINASSILGFVTRTRNDLVSLLGTENPEKLNPSKLPTNDITAFSQKNAALNGTVQINTPDVDPSKGLVELSTNPVDASRQIVSNCNPRRNRDRSSFIATGRGGVAPSPTDKLIGDAVLTEWVSLPTTGNSTDGMQQQHTQQIQESDRYTPIIEAQGWLIDHNGNVVLVAQTPTLTPHSPMLNLVACGLSGNS